MVKSAPNSGNKQLVQEEKLAALQRHGDLKITRKQLPVSVGFNVASIYCF